MFKKNMQLNKIIINNARQEEDYVIELYGRESFMNMKKKSVVTNADFAENSSLSDIEYYKTKNVPATGYYLKDEDDPNTQLSLF